MRLAVAAVLVALASPSAAQFNTGNNALAYCTRDGGAEYSMPYCLGMVAGLYDGLSPSSHGILCHPAGVSLGQVRDVFIQYLRMNPQERHFDSGTIMFKALKAAFPCR